MAADTDAFPALLAEIRACTRCAPHLPLGPRPIVRGLASARVLVISQAPGSRVHATGLSFDDKSGDRLRQWMGIDRAVFYDESQVAVMGMAFCYPGRAANGGDLPPRPECAPLWHPRLRPHFAAVGLTLLVGGYAVRDYLPQTRGKPLARAAARWRDFLPDFFILPHPSWRAAIWERNNPWFLAEALPDLRARVGALLTPPPRSVPCPRR
ncbi:MAG TPA: uracil-DNA glycosylase family protein [Stellaceae bacterium]|nr:uracil-DNA glycosylase family protein [Stellaceae bacterium]